jgi:uncharacterized protein (DUF3084 family)
MENKLDKEEEILDQAENEYDKIVVKSIYYKLKRWEKNLLKKLRYIYLNLKFIKEHKEEIKKQNENLNKEIKKEMDTFEKEKQEILQHKNESIKQIEAKKQNLIIENDKKYKNILSYLDSIKDDKNKLIEFLNNKDILKSL